MAQSSSEFELGEDLLVLAGPKGAGKTTLLTNALRHRAPLFGSAADHIFQSFEPPGAEMEFRFAPQEVIERRTWACNAHLEAFTRAPMAPPMLLVHLDTTDLCGFSARGFASTQCAQDNATAMWASAQAAIFPRYKRVRVATLNTPYELCARWFEARCARWRKTPSANDALLYGGSAEGRAAFAAVQESWRQFAAALPNAIEQTQIDYDGATVSVRPAAGASGLLGAWLAALPFHAGSAWLAGEAALQALA